MSESEWDRIKNFSVSGEVRKVKPKYFIFGLEEETGAEYLGFFTRFDVERYLNEQLYLNNNIEGAIIIKGVEVKVKVKDIKLEEV